MESNFLFNFWITFLINIKVITALDFMDMLFLVYVSIREFNFHFP